MTVMAAVGKPRSSVRAWGNRQINGRFRTTDAYRVGPLTRLLRKYPCRQHRHRPPGCALCLALLPCDARDVEMRPVELFRESRQEARCGDAASGAARDIGEVGEVAVEPFLVIIPQRQLPGAVVRVVAGADQRPSERVAVA